MDPLYAKAQRNMGTPGSRSTMSTREKRKTRKKNRTPKSQTAGQSTAHGGSSVASEQSRQRRQGDRDEEPTRGNENPVGEKCSLCVAGTLHTIDAGLGISCIVYSGIVSVNEATIACACYGSILVLGALCGLVGVKSKSFDRIGLHVSSLIGMFSCFLDIAILCTLLVTWDSFVEYLHKNSEDLLLNKSSIDSIDSLKFLFALIFAVLSVAEGYRFLAMKNLRKMLLARDSGVGSSPSSNQVAPLLGSGRKEMSSGKNWFLSLFGVGKKKRTDDFVIFDDNASMESGLLWPKGGSQAASEDYLEFVPEHEKGLANFTSNVALPAPPPDAVDY